MYYITLSLTDKNEVRRFDRIRGLSANEITYKINEVRRLYYSINFIEENLKFCKISGIISLARILIIEYQIN